MKTSQWIFASLITAFAATAEADIKRHDFTGSGNNGETAVGWVTWDDEVTPDGQDLANSGFGDGTIDNTIAYEITLSGGNVINGPVTFTDADCASGPAFAQTPDFTFDINFFDCESNSNTLDGSFFFTSDLNGESSQINWIPGTTSTVGSSGSRSVIVPVPGSSIWSSLLLIIASLLITRSFIARYDS